MEERRVPIHSELVDGGRRIDGRPELEQRASDFQMPILRRNVKQRGTRQRGKGRNERRSVFHKAVVLLCRGLEKNLAATDESEAVESIGYSAPRLVQGESTNIKVTFAEDVILAELILERIDRVEL